MKSDATRDTFEAKKHFSHVVMQQGRVGLDSDHNEQVAIFWHYLRALAEDVIGAHAAPTAGGGFELAPDAQGGVFTISRGRYYVDGILVENDASCKYTEQPFFPLPADDHLAHLGAGQPAKFFVYIDVWEHHITWIEDGSLREVALGGPDTCTRAKIIWQVRAAPFDAGQGGGGGAPPEPDCSLELANLVELGGGTLAARIDPGVKIADPCVMPPESKYRGAENQLYRVEIHRGGDLGVATFKWSRDNGSVLTPLSGIAGNDLQVASTRGFQAGDWVELTNDALDLRSEPGILLRLAAVQSGALSMDPDQPSIAVDTVAGLHPKVRRWNQLSSEDITLEDGAIPVTVGTEGKPAWVNLEGGVQVAFSGAGPYRTGDYWLIPARVATGAIEWPSKILTVGKPPVATSLAPRGIHHHYAPLGFLAWNGTKLDMIESCRCTFEPTAVCPAGPAAAVDATPPTAKK